MHWLSRLDGPVEADAPLAERTWFGLGGRASYLVHPTDSSALARLLPGALDARVPLKVLGGGANVLIRDDGFDGLVVLLDRPAFCHVDIAGERVRAGAGTDLMKLVRRCSQLGLAGLEGLAGIPGTVGGAIRMNAGGKYGEIGEAVQTVEVIAPDGSQRVLPQPEVGFRYRHTDLGPCVVTGATFQLRRENPAEVYARFKRFWREKKSAQPMSEHSAGCIFTNPPGDSAGRLIDRAGLKGASCGRARVSARHANFIVADEGATAGDVLHLIDLVRGEVQKQFGTRLELEIDVW